MSTIRIEPNAESQGRTKAYVAAVCVTGLALLGFVASTWHSANPTLYGGLLLLSLAAATRKIRLPRTTSNISIGFLFILMAIAEFSFSETVALAAATALLQSVWSKRKPRFEQVLFNVAALALSAGAAYWASHRLLNSIELHSHTVLLSFATCIFFLVDTGLVAEVLALSESKPFREVWRQCCLWSFPYYFVGSGIAALIAVSSHAVGWALALLVLPMMYLVYTYYRILVERSSPGLKP